MTTVTKPAWAWPPILVALALGAGMIWLAGGPLEPALGDAGLLNPAPGPRAEFPRSFSWTPVPGADRYEIVVAQKSGEVLFRQVGTSTILDLAFDPRESPPPGPYVWAVTAHRGPDALGTATGEFEVTP